MIKHIVMWKLRDKTDAPELKERLEALNGKIQGLLKLEVGIDFRGSGQSADMVLVAELVSHKALDIYQNHPAHQAVIPLMKASAVSRTVADYEI